MVVQNYTKTYSKKILSVATPLFVSCPLRCPPCCHPSTEPMYTPQPNSCTTPTWSAHDIVAADISTGRTWTIIFKWMSLWHLGSQAFLLVDFSLLCISKTRRSLTVLFFECVRQTGLISHPSRNNRLRLPRGRFVTWTNNYGKKSTSTPHRPSRVRLTYVAWRSKTAVYRAWWSSCGISCGRIDLDWRVPIL